MARRHRQSWHSVNSSSFAHAKRNWESCPVNKQQLSERDICTQFITPVLEQAGWDTSTQIREEFPLTKGRIVVRSYNLDCKNPHKVEVNHRDPEELMQEYKDIARRLEEAQNALKKELVQALGGKA
jgi:hypothetical protein